MVQLFKKEVCFAEMNTLQNDIYIFFKNILCHHQFLKMSAGILKELSQCNVRRNIEPNERLVYGWRKIMENIMCGYGHHE